MSATPLTPRPIATGIAPSGSGFSRRMRWISVIDAIYALGGSPPGLSAGDERGRDRGP
jgi:hypothetical protein